MLTDLDLANLCLDTYWEAQNFDRIAEADGVFAGIKHYKDYSVIAFRGSTTLLDWLRDFQAVMVEDTDIGGVEQGFRRGMRDTIAVMGAELQVPSPNFYITGHSLGAARALVFAALLCEQGFGRFIKGVTVFGSPRPGGGKIAELLKGTPVKAYRNGSDPVCAVPVSVPLLAEYVHPTVLTAVDIPPKVGDEWGFMARHHMELYKEAMERMYGQSDTSV